MPDVADSIDRACADQAGAKDGETVATYMVERDRAATRREWMMIGLAGASCLASVTALAAALS